MHASRACQQATQEEGTLMKRLLAFALSLGLVIGAAVPVAAEVNAVTPSTNAENQTKGWAHFLPVNVGIGEVIVDFVSTRSFASCFEYRSDGDTSQKIAEDNYNTAITDGLYPFTCVNNSQVRKSLYADEYVEIRMVFGAERDERFDWTRLDVGTKTSCKNGGWEAYGFANQGACVSAVVSNRRN
jgi:hypothetical protein